MRSRQSIYKQFFWALLIFTGLAQSACNPAKHLEAGENMLRKNSLKLTTVQSTTRKGEIVDNLERLVAQKTNTYFLGNAIPYKVFLYNMRYRKFKNNAADFQLSSKTVEKPVVFDSNTVKRSILNMRSYLFNQGFFYAEISDTVVYKKRKAYVTYRVNTGTNFLINNVFIETKDDNIKAVIEQSMKETVLEKGSEFSNAKLEAEQSRIASFMKENSYFKFTRENIRFEMDTSKKEYRKDSDNPFETAINFVTLSKKTKKPTMDVFIIVEPDGPKSFEKFGINNVVVFPDFISGEDARDNRMLRTEFEGMTFRYHQYYIREQVLRKSIYLEKGKYYKQSNYDATINKLNQLGIFQTVRISLVEDTAVNGTSVAVYVLLSPALKQDLTANFEVSTGASYDAGFTPSITFREKNLGKGANLFTASVRGGIETNYDNNIGKGFFDHFQVLTKSVGFNTSIDFPKYLLPVRQKLFKGKTFPRTILSFGANLLDRVDFFTLTNVAAGINYNWKETITKTWDVSPAFINIIRLPQVSDSFRKRLADNSFLRNSYKENFIEGENISFTFSNELKNKGASYTYLKLGFEEAGGLIGAINSLSKQVNEGFRFDYANYFKFDFDLHRYIIRPRSQVALRFDGGVGIPYAGESSLPYVKQYFVGGAYSIRGWRVRSLGPGSYFDTTSAANLLFDRTGDIKLEMNAEYRFDMVQLFSGSLKLKGALFADAGNIWLAKPSDKYPNGEFNIGHFGSDIALSAGAGLRIDIASFFIFRFDAAVPLRKPYLTQNDGFVFNEIDFGSNSWRYQNLILNFAIGYPF